MLKTHEASLRCKYQLKQATISCIQYMVNSEKNGFGISKLQFLKELKLYTKLFPEKVQYLKCLYQSLFEILCISPSSKKVVLQLEHHIELLKSISGTTLSKNTPSSVKWPYFARLIILITHKVMFLLGQWPCPSKF